MKHLTKLSGLAVFAATVVSCAVSSFARGVAYPVFLALGGPDPALPNITALSLQATRPGILALMSGLSLTVILLSELFFKDDRKRLMIQTACLLVAVLFLVVVMFGFFLPLYVPDTRIP